MGQLGENIYYPVKNGEIEFGNISDALNHTFDTEPTFLQGFISRDILEDSGANWRKKRIS